MIHIGLAITKFIVVVLGLLIARQSYRASVRHDNQPMLYFSLGFSLISIGAVIEGILYEKINLSIFYSGMIQSIVVASGMVIILYSLHHR